MRAWGDETFSRRSCPRVPSHRRSRKPSPTSGPGTEGKDQLTRNRSGPSTCQPSNHGCNEGSGAGGQESELFSWSSGLDRTVIPQGTGWDTLQWERQGPLAWGQDRTTPECTGR